MADINDVLQVARVFKSEAEADFMKDTYSKILPTNMISFCDAVIELLKKQNGLMLSLEQANATINYLNEEKEKAIKEIEERKAFNLRCEGKPGWLMKGIDVGLNTALDILKGKDDE